MRMETQALTASARDAATVNSLRTLTTKIA